MPRSGPVRRPSRFSLSGSESFAMKRPKTSAQVSTSALQKVGELRLPYVAPESWQLDAATYYEVIGEVAYVIDLLASTLAACEIRPVQEDRAQNPGGWKETDDERVHRVWDAFLPPQGGKTELYEMAASQLQIMGESYLVGLPLLDAFGREAGIGWEFLSPEELKIEGSGRNVKIKRFVGIPGAQPKELDPDTYIARLHKPDPRFLTRPNCSLKHVLPICREIVVLTQVVDAISKSRMSAGILFVPDEMSFGPNDETEEDSEATDEIDPFTDELIQQLTAPVEDRTSAASLVPLIMRGPAEFYDKVQLIDLARNLDTLYIELREEARVRLAVGMNVPPEIMAGKGGLNHWTGYNIDSDFIKKHVEPVGVRIAEFLTSAYLLPMLVEFEDMSEDEAATYRLFFDPSKVASRMDSGPMAQNAFSRKEISRVAYLREIGLDDSDAPERDERKDRDLRGLMEAEPIVYGPQIMGMLYPELEGKLEYPIDPTSKDVVPAGEKNPSDVPGSGNKTGPSARPVSDQDTGQGEPTPRGPAAPRDEASLINRLATAADGSMGRALERAGNRLMSKMNGSHVSLKDRFSAMPIEQVVGNISDSEMRALGITKTELFSGAWDSLVVRGRSWVQQFFTEGGDDVFTAEAKASAVMGAMVALLETELQSVAERPNRVGPNGLRIPDILVETALQQGNHIS